MHENSLWINDRKKLRWFPNHLPTFLVHQKLKKGMLICLHSLWQPTSSCLFIQRRVGVTSNFFNWTSQRAAFGCRCQRKASIVFNSIIHRTSFQWFKWAQIAIIVGSYFIELSSWPFTSIDFLMTFGLIWRSLSKLFQSQTFFRVIGVYGQTWSTYSCGEERYRVNSLGPDFETKPTNKWWLCRSSIFHRHCSCSFASAKRFDVIKSRWNIFSTSPDYYNKVDKVYGPFQNL